MSLLSERSIIIIIIGIININNIIIITINVVDFVGVMDGMMVWVVLCVL